MRLPRRGIKVFCNKHYSSAPRKDGTSGGGGCRVVEYSIMGHRRVFYEIVLIFVFRGDLPACAVTTEHRNNQYLKHIKSSDQEL